MSCFLVSFLFLLLTINAGVGYCNPIDDSTESQSRLIWADEFETLDEDTWQHLVTGWRGGNREFEYYRNSRKNSYVKNGVLYLKPSFTADEFSEEFLYSGTLDLLVEGCNLDWGEGCIVEAGQDIINPIQSARIRTLPSFNFKYGRVEIRAQMPRGDWIWPAIWMKPTRNVYGPWPASGEIDIVEARANKNLYAGGRSQGIDVVGATLHYGINSTYNIWRPTHWEMTLEGTGSDFADDFHLYVLEWTDYYFRFSIDGVEMGTVVPPAGGFWEIGQFDEKVPGATNIWAGGEHMAPFDQEFFIILNVAVGGNFFPDGWTNIPYPRPWNWSSPHPMRDFWESRNLWHPTWKPETDDSAMKVDYIRVYSV